MIITEKYLTFPVAREAAPTKVYFRRAGRLVYDLDIRLSDTPDFTAYVDMSRFCGQDIEVSAPCGTACAMPPDDAATAAVRPICHFAVTNGWHNDPNGLIAIDGVWHMYYQYNPCAPSWGNMHWGHAISRDLLHWQEQDIALFPDEHGTVFSGCALRDREGQVCFFYTAAGNGSALSGGKPYTQRMARLTGQGLVRCPDEIVGCIENGNRDPHVVWVAECGCYMMVLFLGGDRFAFLAGDDLIHWTQRQTVSLPGESECPNLVRIGGRWILIGAHGVYVPGHFEEDLFVMDQPPRQMHHVSRHYAGQVFAGTDVWIDWLADTVPDARFSQQMTLPCRLALAEDADGVRLIRRPIEAWTDGLMLSAVQGPGAYELRLDGTGRERLTLALGEHALIVDPQENRVSWGDLACPLSHLPGRFELRVILDRSSIEVLTDGGRFYFAGVFRWRGEIDPRFAVYQWQEKEHE